MCYSTYISTDSAEDLAKRNSEAVRFTKVTASNADSRIDLLEYPHKWFVGSKTECSCSFRHLMSGDLGFDKPQDWFPEEQEDIEATKELYNTLKWLLTSGHKLDLMDCWAETRPGDIAVLAVNLDEVSEDTFRMFENYKFKFMRGGLNQGVQETPDGARAPDG